MTNNDVEFPSISPSTNDPVVLPGLYHSLPTSTSGRKDILAGEENPNDSTVIQSSYSVRAILKERDSKFETTKDATVGC